MMREFISAQALSSARERSFARRSRWTCSCAPRELREERGGLQCASCGAPIIRRRTSEGPCGTKP